MRASQIDAISRRVQRAYKIRNELGADYTTPPELITRPPWIVRREDFQRKVRILKRLEQQAEDMLVLGIQGR